MNLEETKQAIGKFVMSRDPGFKMVHEQPEHGPYRLLKITKAGLAILEGREQYRVPPSLLRHIDPVEWEFGVPASQVDIDRIQTELNGANVFARLSYLLALQRNAPVTFARYRDRYPASICPLVARPERAFIREPITRQGS